MPLRNNIFFKCNKENYLHFTSVHVKTKTVAATGAFFIFIFSNTRAVHFGLLSKGLSYSISHPYEFFLQ